MEKSQIEISGLTKRQRALCDIIWGMDSLEEISGFVSSLPPRDQQECKTLVDLMVLATIDEIDTVSDEVKDLIDSIRCR